MELDRYTSGPMTGLSDEHSRPLGVSQALDNHNYIHNNNTKKKKRLNKNNKNTIDNNVNKLET